MANEWLRIRQPSEGRPLTTEVDPKLPVGILCYGHACQAIVSGLGGASPTYKLVCKVYPAADWVSGPLDISQFSPQETTQIHWAFAITLKKDTLPGGFKVVVQALKTSDSSLAAEDSRVHHWRCMTKGGGKYGPPTICSPGSNPIDRSFTTLGTVSPANSTTWAKVIGANGTMKEGAPVFPAPEPYNWAFTFQGLDDTTKYPKNGCTLVVDAMDQNNVHTSTAQSITFTT
jgi:hypothetical protein